MWRRFTEGKIGSLSAWQYTEVQDAVQSLSARLDSKAIAALAGPQPILARILGPGIVGTSVPGAGSVPGSTSIEGTKYAFEQLFVRLTDTTIEVAARPYGIVTTRDGPLTTTSAIAIDLAERSALPPGAIVMLFPLAIDMGESGIDAPEFQTVYIINPLRQAGVRKMFITQVLAEVGKYMASGSMGGTSEEPVMITNIYETSNHYGASLPPSNPNQCATIVPKRLGLGDEVFVWGSAEFTYTMAPTRFESECVPCETSPLAMNSTEIANAIEMSAATIVMR